MGDQREEVVECCIVVKGPGGLLERRGPLLRGDVLKGRETGLMSILFLGSTDALAGLPWRGGAATKDEGDGGPKNRVHTRMKSSVDGQHRLA